MTTTTVTRTWQRSIERALSSGAKACRRRDGTYRVASASRPGMFHTVTVDQASHINSCTCEGWARYGRSNPCRHCGAVAVAIAYFSNIELVPAIEPAVIETRGGRSQALRMQEAAA